MKSSLAFLILFFTITISNAQTETGNLLVGGEVFIDFTGEKQKFGSTTSDVSNTFSISARPKVGYFFMDGLVAGLELNFQSSSTKFDDDEKVTTHGFGVGPFARYYLDNGLFGEVFVGVGSVKVEAPFFGEQKSSLFGYRLGVGYAIFLGDHIAIEPSIMYDRESQKVKDSDAKSILSVIEIGIGLKAYLDFR